uniref:Uncharacterized protein n=1 Tax=Rhizophora mucronata TaxID=61149 RepID=A0A2P2Q051_RHIMU
MAFRRLLLLIGTQSFSVIFGDNCGRMSVLNCNIILYFIPKLMDKLKSSIEP